MKHDPNARQPPGEPDPMRESAFDRAFREVAERSTSAFDTLRDLSRSAVDHSVTVAAVIVTTGLSAREQLAALWDGVAPGVASATADIRKHVLEEGWFGREVTPRDVEVVGVAPAASTAPLGFHELMQAQTAMLPPAANPSAPDPDRSHTPDV